MAHAATPFVPTPVPTELPPLTPAQAAALAELQAALPTPGVVRTDAATCYAASFDNLRLSFLPQAVVAPRDEDDVGTVLRLANRHGEPVTARGAGSATTGSAAPVRGGWVLDLAAWTRCHIDTATGLAYVQPGVTTGALHRAAEAEGWFYPPDPSSHQHCTIGGNIACNAGGLRAAKYGVTRDYVVSLEGFLPTGEFVRWGLDVRKYASGYNIRDLWVGSEGTLGVITGAVLRLVPKPAARWTALFALPDEAAACEAVAALLTARLQPCILEFLDRQTVACTEAYHGRPTVPEAPGCALLLLELDGHPAQVADDRQRALDLLGPRARAWREAPDRTAAEALWHVRRTCSQAMFTLRDGKLNEDIVVPLRSHAALLAYTLELRDQTGLPTPTFGHAADGNFHVHLMYRRADPAERAAAARGVELLMQKVVELGGAITGEHGIGLAKSPFLRLQHSETEIGAMLALKRALDPRGILNPGKLFEPFEVWHHPPVEVRRPWDKH